MRFELKRTTRIKAAIGIGLVVILSIGVILTRKLVDTQRPLLDRLQKSALSFGGRLSNLEQEYQNYSASTTRMIGELSSRIVSIENRLDADRNTVNKEISRISSEVAQQQSTYAETATEKLPDDLIAKIMKRVVFVHCRGPRGEISGSGSTQLAWNVEPIVLTNFHILDVGSIAEISCEIHLSQPPDYSNYGKAHSALPGRFDTNYPAIDVAVLHVQGVTEEERAEYFGTFPVPFCRTQDIQVGNAMTLFGYPKFGTNTLTVTDGVTSGVIKTNWGLKYKTSAKMDLGNSGGVAVDNKFRCIIGIPTWTQFGGQIGELIKTGESLGQIQSWEMIVTSGRIFE